MERLAHHTRSFRTLGEDVPSTGPGRASVVRRALTRPQSTTWIGMALKSVVFSDVVLPPLVSITSGTTAPSGKLVGMFHTATQVQGASGGVGGAPRGAK